MTRTDATQAPNSTTSSQGTHARTVLVAGAAGGMAQGINQRLAAAGHTVLLADLDEQKVAEAAARVEESGGRALPFLADITDADSVAALRTAVEEQAGGADVLVNAAGLLDRKMLKDHTRDSFAAVLDVNLVGAFRMIQEFSPRMVENGWGRIVNISSIAGINGYPYPSYAASKAGLTNLTRSLVLDLRRTGVTVNAICPGVVDTGMVIDEVRAVVEEKVPTGTVVDPEEIGAMIAFLITPEARNINGANLVIDGGLTAAVELFRQD
jgi:NAD(P)-dependent dehydrogenase (short-subunit alcohol dehydrogenase family)